MHTTTITGGVTRASAAALLMLALTACGSETAEPAAESSGSDAGAATLTDQPFCSSVDAAAVAGVLGLAEDKVRTRVDRAVGDEFEGPDEEAAPATSEANLCVFGSSTSQFVVSVQPDATSADVQETVDELAGLTGEESSESCESRDADAFGDPAAVFACSSTMERVRVVATGLVGDSKFYCAAMRNEGAGETFEQDTVDACTAMLEELSAGV